MGHLERTRRPGICPRGFLLPSQNASGTNLYRRFPGAGFSTYSQKPRIFPVKCPRQLTVEHSAPHASFNKKSLEIASHHPSVFRSWFHWWCHTAIIIVDNVGRSTWRGLQCAWHHREDRVKTTVGAPPSMRTWHLGKHTIEKIRGGHLTQRIT